MEKNYQDLISVIVPIFNIEDYLPKCLNTIARQTYNNLEIILVDDGSTDNSGKVCDEFARKDTRTIVIHQENKGQGSARNAGQRVAKGEYVMFVDGDDYLHLEAIQFMYEALLQGDYEMAMINYKITSNHDENIKGKIDRDYSVLSQADLINGYFSGSSLFNPVWNKLFKKNLIEGLWSRDYKRGQDSDYALRVIMRVNKAIWINNPLYFYYQREGSITHDPQNVITGYRCHAQFLFDNIIDLPPEKNCFMHYLLKDIYRVMINYIAGAWNTDEISVARQQCLQYEKKVRKKYWHDSHFGIVEKFAMTVNVRYPHIVRSLKKATGNNFSWHLLSNF